MENEPQQPTVKEKPVDKFVEGEDYYFDGGLMVLTARFLQKRGYCCDNSCRHCPYREDLDPDYNK